jgi:sugar phosphate isomerase/epimerase
MRLACSTRPFSEDRLDLALAKVAWAGYPAVEVNAANGTLPDEELLRARLRAEELELAALDAGVLPVVGASAEGLTDLAALGRAAALVRALDGPLIVARAPAQGELSELAATLRLLDRALDEVAVDVCLLHAPDTLLSTPDDLHALWAIGLPTRVGIALDPALAALAGWDPLALGQLPALPRHVYLTDARNGKATPPGDGEIDLAAFGAALRQAEYSGAVTVLLENADPWAVEPVARESAELAAAWLGANIR